MAKIQYKPLGFAQREQDWHEWRKLGIGASESSVIMGSLPFEYEDILFLWKKKAGLPVPEFVVTEQVQRGIDLEDEAVRKFTEIVGTEVSPECYNHPQFPFLRASMDGIDKDHKIAVEIKCPSAAKFYTAKKGIILDYYYTQLQQQMACTGLPSIYYFVYRQKEGSVLFKVNRNEEYINELIRRSTIFWKMVEDFEPCLPRHLGINMWKEVSDPFIAGDHSPVSFEVYKN